MENRKFDFNFSSSIYTIHPPKPPSASFENGPSLPPTSEPLRPPSEDVDARVVRAGARRRAAPPATHSPQHARRRAHPFNQAQAIAQARVTHVTHAPTARVCCSAGHFTSTKPCAPPPPRPRRSSSSSPRCSSLHSPRRRTPRGCSCNRRPACRRRPASSSARGLPARKVRHLSARRRCRSSSRTRAPTDPLLPPLPFLCLSSLANSPSAADGAAPP